MFNPPKTVHQHIKTLILTDLSRHTLPVLSGKKTNGALRNAITSM